MQIFNQPGEVITLAAPYDRLSGQGALVGAQFGVAVSDVLNGVNGRFLTQGVVTLAKTDSQAMTQGATLYWDDTNKRLDATVVGPAVGTCVEAVAATGGLITVKIKLKEAPTKAPVAAIAAVATADSDGTYGAAESTLINELKTQLNLVITALKTHGISLV